MPPIAPAPPRDPNAPLTLQHIQDYVWKRYVEMGTAPYPLDEDKALAFLERHYRDVPVDTDAECFYYAILAYERSFASDRSRPTSLATLALSLFESYRRQTGPDFRWEPVEDRYTDLVGDLRAKTRQQVGSST